MSNSMCEPARRTSIVIPIQRALLIVTSPQGIAEIFTNGKDNITDPRSQRRKRISFYFGKFSVQHANLIPVTSLEYAYAKAPANMKSMVMSINLFMSAFASAIGQAFTPLSEDPLLVWNYTIITILAFLGGVGFWFCFRDLDANEDKLNMLERSNMQGKNTVVEPKDTEAQVQHVHEQKN